MPFDAMKGLKEALAIREERHNRVENRELSEDTISYSARSNNSRIGLIDKT